MKKVIENFVVLETPLQVEDLNKKLFQAIQLQKLKADDNVYIYILYNKNDNRLFFGNHSNWNQKEYSLVGNYKYCNFFGSDEGRTALALSIFKSIKKIQQDGNGS